MEEIPLGKRLFAQFSINWNERFLRNFPDDTLIDFWCAQWESALSGFNREAIAGAVHQAITTFDWPPVLAEFIRMCDEGSGLPSFEEAFQKALRRDFDIPAVREAFNTIGDWDFRRATDKDLRKRFSFAWKDAVRKNRSTNMLEHKEVPNGLEIGTQRTRATRVPDEKGNMARQAVDFMP